MINKDFWKNKTVLITGSTGFVGSWVTKKLVQENARVISLVRDEHKKSSMNLICGSDLPDTIIHGDISNFQLISRVISEYNVNIVLHLAAQAIVGVANNQPLSTFKSNIEGTWNVLEACKNSSSVKSIVIASSDKSYGEPQFVPIKENHPLNAVYPYDASKACAEILSKTYAKSYGLPVLITKCSNIYGGGDLNFNRIIPETIKSIIQNKNPIIRSDGTPIRDFIFIEDIVNAYLIIAEMLFENKELRGETFNFGTSHPTSVLELVSTIIKLMGNQTIKPIIQNNSKNEIQEQYLDSTKAHEQLNWNAQISLNEGLLKSINWYKSYLKV